MGTTYRFYVNAENPTDKLSAVFGNNESPLIVKAPEGIYNDPFNTSWNASGVNEAFFAFFPDLAVTVTSPLADGPAAGVPGAEGPFGGAGRFSFPYALLILPGW